MIRVTVKLVDGVFDKAADTWTQRVEINGARRDVVVVYRQSPAEGSNRRYTVERDGDVLFADTSEKSIKGWRRDSYRRQGDQS